MPRRSAYRLVAKRCRCAAPTGAGPLASHGELASVWAVFFPPGLMVLFGD